MNRSAETTECSSCRASVRLASGEVERILAAYLADYPAALVNDAAYERRLTLCVRCPDLLYGTTCRHCGCLVAIRAKVALKACPSPQPHWVAVPSDWNSDRPCPTSRIAADARAETA